MTTEQDVHEEIQLLAAIGLGNRNALRDLYDRYSAPLYSLALRFTGNAEDAEEVLQDSFVKIWRKAGDYNERQSRPFTWAVTILRRTSIDLLRRRQRQPGTELLDEESSGSVLATPETIRANAETRDNGERLRAALSSIAPPKRAAIELALYSTLTHAEIARRLALPVGSVKTWIRRGLLDLRAALNETSPTSP